MLEKFKQQIKYSLGDKAEFCEKNWEIVWLPIAKVEQDGRVWAKIRGLTTKLLKGSIFPPIILGENKEIMDGEHRILAYKLAGKKSIPVLRAIGEGNGRIVKDNVYSRLKLSKKKRFYLTNGEEVKCLVCGQLMVVVGHQFFCEKCNLRVERDQWLSWGLIVE